MSNNNTHDIDKYEYVTYADKYFGDQPDNETIYTEPMFIKHSKTNGFDLSKEKYLLNTYGPTNFIFNQLMNKNIGTYQISFQNIECEKLEDVEIGVLPITKKYKEGNIHNRDYGVNFAGHPLAFKQFFKKFLNEISKPLQQTDQYKDYNRFVYHHKIFPTPKNSILTMRLNTEDGTMIFLLILHQ
jgi:hypothetical protein